MLSAAEASRALLGQSPLRAFDPKAPNLRGYGSARVVFQLVDRLTGVPVVRHVVLAHVSTLRVQPETRASLHYTAGGAHLDLPSRDARGFERFSVRIESGVWPVGEGADKPDGMAAVWAIQRLFNDYLGATIGGRPRSDFDFEFINTDAPISADDPGGNAQFVIVPDRVGPEVTRDSRRPALWTLNLMFTGFERRDGRRVELLRRRAQQRNFFQRVLDAIGELNAYSFDQLFARYQGAIARFVQAVAAVRDVARFLEGWSRGIDTFIAYNIGLLQSLVDALGQISLTLSEEIGVNQFERFGPDGRVMRGFEQIKRTVTRLRNAVGANLENITSGLAGSGTIGAQAGVSSQASPIQAEQSARHLNVADADADRPLASAQGTVGTSEMRVTAGMTLANLVPSGFTQYDIIRLNGLVYPFVDGIPRPAGDTSAVAYLGEKVLVPVPRGNVSVTAGGAAPGAGGSAEDRIFGVDWMIKDGAFVFDYTAGDLRRVRGLDNLLQALTTRLVVPAGSLNYAPDLGSTLRSESLAWATPEGTRLAMISAQNALASDPRVATVRRIEVEQSNGIMNVSFDLDTIDGSPRGRQALRA